MKRIIILLGLALTFTGCSPDDPQIVKELDAVAHDIEVRADAIPETDVCDHWAFMAEPIHYGMGILKDYQAPDPVKEMKESQGLTDISKASAAYKITNAMILAADQGKTIAEVEQISRSICKTFPEDAADDAGGAWEPPE